MKWCAKENCELKLDSNRKAKKSLFVVAVGTGGPSFSWTCQTAQWMPNQSVSCDSESQGKQRLLELTSELSRKEDRQSPSGLCLNPIREQGTTWERGTAQLQFVNGARLSFCFGQVGTMKVELASHMHHRLDWPSFSDSPVSLPAQEAKSNSDQ